jgi:hypothetical protein
MIDLDNLKKQLSYDEQTGIFKWKVSKRGLRIGDIAGSKRQHGYIAIRINHKLIYAHRLAWFYMYEVWPTGEIDHIDGNRLNNSKANLRDVNPIVNKQNIRSARSDNVCGMLGVFLDKRSNKYVSKLQTNGKQKWLGLFETPEKAHQAYLEAKRQIHEGCTI